MEYLKSPWFGNEPYSCFNFISQSSYQNLILIELLLLLQMLRFCSSVLYNLYLNKVIQVKKNLINLYSKVGKCMILLTWIQYRFSKYAKWIKFWSSWLNIEKTSNPIMRVFNNVNTYDLDLFNLEIYDENRYIYTNIHKYNWMIYI